MLRGQKSKYWKERKPKKKRITEHIRPRGQTRKSAKHREKKQDLRNRKRRFSSNGVGKTTCEKLKSEPNRAEKAT